MCLSVSPWAVNQNRWLLQPQHVVGAAAGCSFASQHRYMTGAGSEFLLGVVVFSHVTGGLCTLPPHRLACPEAIRVTGWWCWGGSPNLEFPHSSLGFHASIPRKKTEVISANCDFYCIYSRIITIFYRKPWNQIAFKNKTKKIKHRKQTKKPCCMAATANLFPWAVHTEILSQLFIYPSPDFWLLPVRQN